mgnify:FL=1
MKRRLLVILFVFAAFCFDAAAQGRTLRFVYVAHDENTVTQKLIYVLRDYYNDALNYPEQRAVVFYLPNGNYPEIVRVNTPDENPKDFDRIVAELQGKRSHDVDVSTDLENIQRIFRELETNGGGLESVFESMEWDWYINSTFWALGYNESVIAALSWIMEMPSLVAKGYLDLKFYSDENDILPVADEHPFGQKGLMDGINFIPLTY